jgi:hypothetical protein
MRGTLNRMTNRGIFARIRARKARNAAINAALVAADQANPGNLDRWEREAMDRLRVMVDEQPPDEGQVAG